MKKILFLPLVFLYILAFSQTRTVTGKVLSEKDAQAIANATITLNASITVIANNDGIFSITIPTEKNLLTVSSIGYIDKTILVGKNENYIIIKLSAANKDLNEVVVVGYSDKKRSELTSSITVVSAEKLKDVSTNDVGAMLQGKVAGLQVINSSGVPGASAEIRLRGISSVNASQSPLYVVDGIIGGNFDPNDIESITVLKDAAATAMYGSQANAGVIVVTTKKGKLGKPSTEFKVVTGFRKPDYGKMLLMNGAELYEYQKEFYRDYIPGTGNNSYKIDLLKFNAERPRSLQSQNYSWPDAIFKHAWMQNYYVSISGRTEKNTYYFGLSYYNEKGTFLNTDFQRINLRASSTMRLSNKVSVTNNINISGVTGKSYDYQDVYYAYLNLPWDNSKDSSGNPMYVDGNASFKWWSRDKLNPLHTIQNSEHPYKGFDVNYDFAINITFTNWLSFSSTNRVSAGFSNSKTYYSPKVAGQFANSGYLNEQNSFNYGGISNNIFKLNFIQKQHSFGGIVGVAFEGGKTETSGASGRGLPLNLKVLNVVSNNVSVNGFNEQNTLQSFLSQFNYGYANKYFFTASYRIDGSTAFQKNNRYGSFPSVSAAWLATNENFLKHNKKITNLKVRAGYGITGTQDIGASRYLGLYSLSTQYNNQSAATPLQLSSPGLTWESKHQFNAGIDAGLFNRINFSLDVYHNITKNLLLQVSQPLSVGFETRWGNAGEIVNNGVELALNTINIATKKFSWSTDFNINFNSNRLQNLPENFIKTGAWSISQTYKNGGNLYEFYMPVWLGVDKQTGAPLWEKITKNNDGNITKREGTSDYSQAAPQEVGSALPKFQGGIVNTFAYKNFSLSVNIYYLSGNKVYSNNLRFLMNDGNEPYYNQIVLPKQYSIWTKPGDDATNPSPQNAANAQEVSTRYLKDGSFLSIRNITLSYNLTDNALRKLKMQSVILSVSADNVHTFTKFLGQDPQTTITPNLYSTPGVSDFKYPNNKQFLFNINIKF
jgi:TonB-linked SusC/RagA family outer membrane protein